MKTVLSNMGFVMQMAGLLVLIPIILSFAYNELTATIGLFITATAFMALGFILNALCERKELNFKQSSALIVLVFIFLSLIGAIPYWYTGAAKGEAFSRITDGIFESASGFTTTGFSVIPDLSKIPKSIIFYRALTQFIGGIGIVLVLLAFFFPDEKLQNLSRSMGFPTNHKIKKTFILILMIYLFCTTVMVAIGFIGGYKDIMSLVSFVFSALSTGGFAPQNDISLAATTAPLNYILIIGMIIGASNFIIIAGLFRLKVMELIKSEVGVFILLAGIFTTVMAVAFRFSWLDSAFHVTSAMSTTGFSYLSISQWSDSLKLFLVFLMFVGGASFSTAGGVKIFRLILIFKAIRKVIADSITRQDNAIRLFGKEYQNEEVIHALITIITMAGIICASAFILTGYGFNPVDSVFETTAAITDTGLSVGIAGFSLAVELKWMFIILMILGRVEIFAIFILLSRRKSA